MSHLDLEGIRILDLSRLLPGPFLTMILGDMGADVVKVEAPNVGDYLRHIPPVKGGMSGRFLALNRNKRSLVLDLKKDVGRAAFLKMVGAADVVIETFRPGVMARLGIGYEDLKLHNDKIILCSISGFGQTGCNAERAGHDIGYLSLSGVLAMSGGKPSAPSLPGVQIADLGGGALWGATAVLGALIGRERQGTQHLDISMTEGALSLLAAEFGNLDCGVGVPSRGRESLNGGLACYDVYETLDGKFVSVGALEPKFWLAFNKAIGRQGHPAEVMAPASEQEKLRDELAEIMLTKTRDEWTTILSKHDCCAEPVLELDEVLEQPLHIERKTFFTINHGEEEVLGVRTPVGEARARRPAPGLGEHSEEVLREYGLAEDEIKELL